MSKKTPPILLGKVKGKCEVLDGFVCQITESYEASAQIGMPKDMYTALAELLGVLGPRFWSVSMLEGSGLGCTGTVRPELLDSNFILGGTIIRDSSVILEAGSPIRKVEIVFQGGTQGTVYIPCNKDEVVKHESLFGISVSISIALDGE
jgi:hypothetical protein